MSKLIAEVKPSALFNPKGMDVIKALGADMAVDGELSFSVNKATNFVRCTLDDVDCGNVVALTKGKETLKPDAIIDAIDSSASVTSKITALGADGSTFMVEVTTSTPKAKAAAATKAGDYASDIERLTKGGLWKDTDVLDRIAVMKENRVPDELIKWVLSELNPDHAPIERPHTTYKDASPDAPVSIIAKSLIYIMRGKAMIFEGDKSVGKNVCYDTLAWLLSKKRYLISVNSFMENSEIYGGKTTQVPELMTMKQDILAEQAYDWIRAFTGKLHTVEQAKNAAHYDTITKMAAAMQISQETTAFIDWLSDPDGAFLMLNEFNMGDANFWSAVLNPLLDGTKFIDAPGWGRLNLNPKAVLIASQNANYTGTRDQNAATLSRMVKIEFPYPKSIENILKATAKAASGLPEKYFKQADDLYKVFLACVQKGQVSNDCLSVRGFAAALEAAAVVPGFLKLSDALVDCVINVCPEDERPTLETMVKEKVLL